MTKGTKVVLTLVSAFILLVLVLAVVVPMFFNVDRFRPEVVAQIQEETGKPAQIGRLSMTFLPQVAIRVDNFSLGNPAGFPAGDFVKAKKISAVVNASALLHHSVEITSLKLDGLTVNMLEDAQGKWNFENPPTANEHPQQAAAAGSSNPSFTLGVISQLTVADGQFSAATVLPSAVTGPRLMEVDSASIDLHQVNLNAFTASLQSSPAVPGNVTASTGWVDTMIYAAEASGLSVAEGTIKADALKFDPIVVTSFKSKFRLYPKQLFFDDLSLSAYGGGAIGNLSLDFGGPALAYKVDAKLKGVNVAEFLAAFPQAKGMMTGVLDGSANVTGAVEHSADPLAGVTGAGQAYIRNGQMPNLQLGSNLRTLARMANLGPSNGDPSSFSMLSADFSIADARLSSKTISLVGNGLNVDGSGSMTMAGEGSLNYVGDASLAASGTNPLATLVGGVTGAKVSNGRLTFPFTVAGTLAKPHFALKGGPAGQAGALPASVQQPATVVRGLAGLLKKKSQ